MTARDWFTKARKEGFAIGAFNVDSLEIFKAIVMAAQRTKSPVIVQFSPGEVGYFGIRNIIDFTVNAREELGIALLLNLDHGKPEEAVSKAIDVSESIENGFTNVHFDGSDLEFEDNISQTQKIVESAHKKGILVEGEINKVSGSSEIHNEDIDLELLKKSYTDPQKAKQFVMGTRVDILAPIFGNIHGTFPVQPDLDIDLIAKIKEALGETFLSLHGGSGIPAVQVKEAIRVGGIVKVNVNTELRVTYKQALEEKLGEQPDEYKIYDLMPEVIAAVAAVVEDKIDVFGSGDKV
ncbi:MAG: class II fructose-bisphosphate aldolase [Patescibacteria group bacterium]